MDINDIMNTPDQISVPLALIKATDLSAHAKLVWIALLLDSGLEAEARHSPTRLALRLGFSRPTIYKALASLRSGGWYPNGKPATKVVHSGTYIMMETALLLDDTLTARARIFHGLLKGSTTVSRSKGQILGFRYSSFGKEFGMCMRTVRSTLGQLVERGWFDTMRANRLAPINLQTHNPIRELHDVIKSRFKQELRLGMSIGQALTNGMLSLLVSSEHYFDNAKYAFMRNKKTGGLLEFDRYFYVQKVAIEYNGPQHDTATDKYDAKTVEEQKYRDALKARFCEKEGIRLVVFRAQDLSIEGILRKIQVLLPSRSLLGLGNLIRFFGRMCSNYRDSIPGLPPVAQPTV